MVRQARLTNKGQFLHQMESRLEGIQAKGPAKWRAYDGIVSAYWDAEGRKGGKGYYLSPDPRLLIFFNDVSSQIAISNSDTNGPSIKRPMERMVYVPAGTPLWTSFNCEHHFSHLDIHLHRDRLLQFLAPSIGRSAAQAAINRPSEIGHNGAVHTLGRLLVDELASPKHHDIFAENLIGAIVSGVINTDDQSDRQQDRGRLTQAQMNRLYRLWDSTKDGKLSVGEMASCVNLSESWFAHVFRQTIGSTPLQWQQAQRIERAKELLLRSSLSIADIATQLGFSDQSHFTNVFRKICGQTPAYWRDIQNNQ